jgi:site-specific DNA-methyltransferase (adenine-specific)
MLRVLKPGGFCAIFQGGRYMRHFWDWFGGQDFIVYASCRPLQVRPPGAGGRFVDGRPVAPCWEPVVVFYKGSARYRSAEFARACNWFFSKSHFDDLARVHPCPKPLDQCEELIRSFTCEGALVLDPLCGVSSVPVAAARCGRRYLGIDLEPEYVRVARRRLRLLAKPGR